MDENIVVLGHCEECRNTIDSECYEAYVDEEGRYFCSVECALEYYGITKLEI